MAVGAGVAAVESAAEQEDAEDESSAQKIKQDVQEERGTRERHIHTNVGEYAGLLGRACPAGVYEYVPVEGNSNSEGTWNGHKLVINSQVNFVKQMVSSTKFFSFRIVYIASCAI
jgi:electron-transferring-flavoprotein dehydrogenase